MITKIKTPAKINIILKITGIDQQSGYHNLETIMAPISLYDEMEVFDSKEFEVETIGIEEDIPTEKNILYKIYKETEKAVGKTLPSFYVKLKKNIPTGAGLGGGSGNGAFFLKFLNDHLKLSLGREKLIEIAGNIGSDIPFFLLESPGSLKGTGCAVSSIKLSGFPVNMLLVYPNIVVNTKAAYEIYDKKNLTNSHKITINMDRVKDVCSFTDWLSFIDNDFEEPIFEIFPKLLEVKEDLEKEADKVFMTGSGSTLISLYKDDDDLNMACNRLSTSGYFVKKVELIY